MKRFSEQFKKKSETIRLRASERSDLRERLTTYMEYHPLPAEMKAAEKATHLKQAEGIVSESFKTIHISAAYIRGFAGVCAVFMIVGVPMIAERSVPGDVLYPVKTQITEELRASLTLSPYAKVEWETQRLGRRVAEARLLANEGKLTPEAEASVAQAVQEHTDAANQGIAAMRETNEDDAAIAEITFATAMEVQSEVLEGHIKGGGNGVTSEAGNSISALADVVNGVRDTAAVAQADSTPSYEGLLGKIESQTTRAYELFSSIQGQASAEEILDIERRLEDVERKLVQAISLHDTDLVTAPEIVPEVSDEESVDEDQEATETIENADSEESLTEPEVGESAPEEISISLADDVVDSDETKEVDSGDLSTAADEAFDVSSEENQEVAVVDTELVVRTLLREVLRDVQKLMSFMTDIDVRQTVTIEELVPVTPTEEERTKTALALLEEVVAMQTQINNREVSQELSEKVVLGKQILLKQIQTATLHIQKEKLDEAQKLLSEAYATASDLQRMLMTSPLIEPDITETQEENLQDSTEDENTEAVADQTQTELGQEVTREILDVGTSSEETEI